ncbi:hypothetical protein B0H19DRAFT_1209765 [Mycena capillaripes]|nr:hypothetical protein B0H19DRAFT_1209765 [Mycena capillaripes]
MGAEEGDEIRCRCGSSLDDGFSIACDVCGRWCHAACFAISKESVPEEWKCWLCAPQNHLDLPPPANGPANRRRRASVSGRRASTVEASPPLSTVDDLEDERTQYVLIDNDIVPDVVTQRKLRAYAAQWRGVSALEPEPPPHAEGHTPFVFGAPPPAHPTLLHPCAPSSSSSASASAYAVLPPTYALHAAAPAPPRTLLARYPSTITPTGVYLRAPTNGYAHAGAPKRFVHLVGPPLDVALDARAAGGRGRWVRSGCWPNAEVRAFVCGGAGAGEGRRHAKEDGVRVREREMDGEGEPRTHFGIFATRALREGEEIVVGWEWDDANAVHRVAEVAGNGGCTWIHVTPTPYIRLSFLSSAYDY